MTSVKADKRNDGASASPSPSPQRKHPRKGRDAAAWEDPDLFGDADGLHEGEEVDEGRFNHEGHAGKKGKRRSKHQVVSKHSSASSSAAEDAAAAPDTAAAESASSRHRVQRRQRQPPLHASAFLLNPDGSPKDGLLSLYCNVNYALDKLHKFKFLDTLDSREQLRDEHTRELEAAHALLAMHSRKREQNRSEGPPPRGGVGGDVASTPRVYGQQEVVRATITVKHRKRQLARLAAEERLYLREDLNTLLNEIREGLIACYPYNEHLSRLSRRLDKISTQPDLWAKYRPRLVQLHKSNFLQKWEQAGCPLQPHMLLHAEGPSLGVEGDENLRPERCEAPADPNEAMWWEGEEPPPHSTDPWERQKNASHTNTADNSASSDPQHHHHPYGEEDTEDSSIRNISNSSSNRISSSDSCMGNSRKTVAANGQQQQK
ncbi:hypothetical protein ACSSS7_007964 [Eimeria intestinalis]